jgi:hypothetical protein
MNIEESNDNKTTTTATFNNTNNTTTTATHLVEHAEVGSRQYGVQLVQYTCASQYITTHLQRQRERSVMTDRYE